MRKSAALLALLATGCMSMEPQYVRPDPAIPSSWPAGDAYLKESEAALPAITYKDIFQDPRLQSLIHQALTNNRDLMIAAANIAAAREQYRIQRAEQFPQVDAQLGTTATVDEEDSGVDTNFAAGVGITNFELDLFGRLRSLTNVQRNRYFATEVGARLGELVLDEPVADRPDLGREREHRENRTGERDRHDRTHGNLLGSS